VDPSFEETYNKFVPLANSGKLEKFGLSRSCLTNAIQNASQELLARTPGLHPSTGKKLQKVLAAIGAMDQQSFIDFLGEAEQNYRNSDFQGLRGEVSTALTGEIISFCGALGPKKLCFFYRRCLEISVSKVGDPLCRIYGSAVDEGGGEEFAFRLENDSSLPHDDSVFHPMLYKLAHLLFRASRFTSVTQQELMLVMTINAVFLISIPIPLLSDTQRLKALQIQRPIVQEHQRHVSGGSRGSRNWRLGWLQMITGQPKEQIVQVKMRGQGCTTHSSRSAAAVCKHIIAPKNAKRTIGLSTV
jgi:hypothetical protein